jgi:hypothetical protein
LYDEEEAEQRTIRVVFDTSSDDSEFVEQNEIQDHVPLKHHTPRKSARGARVQGHGSAMLTDKTRIHLAIRKRMDLHLFHHGIP